MSLAVVHHATVADGTTFLLASLLVQLVVGQQDVHAQATGAQTPQLQGHGPERGCRNGDYGEGTTFLCQVSHGAELSAALADPAVGIVELVADIHLREEHWAGLQAGQLPVKLLRNVTIRSSAILGYDVLLDLGYVAGKVQLVPGHDLTFQDVVLVNGRADPGRSAPGTDLLAKTVLLFPGQDRPVLRVRRSALVYRLCWGAAAQAAVQLPKRPRELPGVQQYLVPPQAPLQAGCSNSSPALMQRCWPLRTYSGDYAVEGMDLDAVGNPSPNNYVVHLVGVYGLCSELIPEECLLHQSPLACWMGAWNEIRGRPLADGTPFLDLDMAALAAPAPQAPLALPQALAAQPQGAAGGSGAHEVLLPALLGGLLGGALLLVALTTLLWHRRRRRQWSRQESHSPCDTGEARADTSAAATDGSGVRLSAAVANEDAATGSDWKPPHGAGSTVDAGTDGATNTATLHSGRATLASNADVVPLTERTPCQPHVRLDLRWDVDMQVDQSRLRGAGSFGRVLEGDYMGRRVAVKVLHARPKGSGARAGGAQHATDSLLQEARVLSRCCHPNIVDFLGACLTPPSMFLVMELMDQSLDQLLRTPGSLLPLEQVLQIAIDTASGLAYLHPTVVHRDLKPANVLLDASGTAKLTDFGLSRLRETVCETKTPEAGTAAYMAPECFDPANAFITHKADIYSWAVMVWQMLAGKAPWEGQQPLAVAMAVTMYNKRLPLWSLSGRRCPRRLHGLVQECWDSDPQRRPSAEELVKRLLLVREDLQHSGPCLGSDEEEEEGQADGEADEAADEEAAEGGVGESAEGRQRARPHTSRPAKQLPREQRGYKAEAAGGSSKRPSSGTLAPALDSALDDDGSVANGALAHHEGSHAPQAAASSDGPGADDVFYSAEAAPAAGAGSSTGMLPLPPPLNAAAAERPSRTAMQAKKGPRGAAARQGADK